VTTRLIFFFLVKVISVLLAHDPDEWTRAQTALLHAAFAAGCARFAPSDWGCGHRAYASISLLAAQSRVWGACAAVARESEGRFSWAGFQCGLFMNYLGVGALREGEALAGKRDVGEHFFFVGDMRAEIPLGEGGRVPRVSMTEIGDVGRFVAAACGLERWEERMGMVGETVWMDDVVKMMEQVRGAKVEVVYRPLEKVREEKDTERDWGKIFWLELEEIYARDQEDEGVISPTLNRLCPEIRPMKIKEFLIKFWSEV
jgi:hypothetical protein